MANGFPDGKNKKLTQVVQQTTIADDALIYFAAGAGGSRGIKFSDFKTALGVLGTIGSVGDPTGTPILETILTANSIRIFEPGAGIKSSVSPQNGLLVDTDLLIGDAGIPVLIDEATAPRVRNLVAGTGVNIASAGNNIQISAPGVVTASNVVIVNQMSDFPAAVGGVRTLAADTEYLVSARLTTSDRFVLQDNTILNGSNSRTDGLTYTGTGTFLTAVDATCEYSRLDTVVATGTLLNISATGGGKQFLMASVNAREVKTLGTFSGLSLFQALQCSFDDISTTGFAPTGNNSVILMERMIAVTNAGTFLDLGTSTSDAIIIDTTLGITAGGATFLSGLVSSGNINAGGLGSITLGRFSGAGTTLNNVSPDDALWEFAHNDDIPDTRPDGLLSMQGNITATIITVIGTPVLIAGTWTIERVSQMTGTTAGRLTYNGGKDATVPMTASITAEPVSGAAQILSAQVAINGVIQAGSKRTASATPGSPASITVPWQESLSGTDYVEIFVANETTTTNVLVSSAISRVN